MGENVSYVKEYQFSHLGFKCSASSFCRSLTKFYCLSELVFQMENVVKWLLQKHRKPGTSIVTEQRAGDHSSL